MFISPMFSTNEFCLFFFNKNIYFLKEDEKENSIS